MRQRILTAVIGLSILAAVLCFFDTPVVNVAVSFLSALAVYEVVEAAGCTRPRSVLLLYVAFAAVVPFVGTNLVSRILPVLIYAFFVLTFTVCMGCAVNGVGEGKQADIGIAGGDGEYLLFKKGVALQKYPMKDILAVLKAEIESMQPA